MCFGNTQQKSTNTTSSQTYTPNPAVANAATSNINFAQGIQNAGYTPYTGQRVADFGNLQNNAFDLSGNNGNNTIQDLIGGYALAPPGQVNPETIASQMSPYMSQYVNDALTPQLRLQQQQFDTQNRADNAAATSSGAFGDARAGVQTANTREAQDAQRQGLIANAYNTAFNTAIGAGAQDVSNNLTGQTTNASLMEQALARQLGGAQNYEQLANFLQQQGGLQQQQQQAQLNVPYSNYLAGQQYPFLTTQLMNQVIGTGAGAMPASVSGSGTSTTSAPDNSGFQLGGSLLGGIAGNAGLFPALAAL